MEINYRLLKLCDLSLLQKVGRETYEPYYPHIWKEGGLDWYMQRCFGPTVLRSELVDPNLEYWIAEDESGQIIGFLKLVLQKSVPDTPIEQALYLEKVYLMPTFFGSGVGQHLIHFAKQRAQDLKKEAVWLMVMKNGPIQVYERAGYKIIGAVHWDFERMKEAERGGWVMVCACREMD